MLYCLSALTITLIITAASCAFGAMILFILLSSYKIYKKTIHIYARPSIIALSYDKSTKPSQNALASRAIEKFSESKKYFFTRRVKGSAFFLQESDWAVMPQQICQDYGKKKLYAYYFNPKDYCHRSDYLKISAHGTSINEYAGDKWVIILHGYDKCGLDNYKYAYEFIKKGYNVLSPDLVGHGKDNAKYVGMGYLDRQYAKKWIEYLVSICPNADITLFGYSMGGAAALMASGENLPSNVKHVVSDCAFASAWDEIVYLSKLSLKRFGALRQKLNMFLLNVANIYCRLIAGYSLKKADTKAFVAKNSTIPTLIFHGNDDKYVPPHNAQQIFDACNAKKQLKFFDNARHVENMLFHYDEYFSTIYDFIGGNAFEKLE